eukprot:751748-Hanusia_phi.AAC.3
MPVLKLIPLLLLPRFRVSSENPKLEREVGASRGRQAEGTRSRPAQPTLSASHAFSFSSSSSSFASTASGSTVPQQSAAQGSDLPTGPGAGEEANDAGEAESAAPLRKNKGRGQRKKLGQKPEDSDCTSSENFVFHPPPNFSFPQSNSAGASTETFTEDSSRFPWQEKPMQEEGASDFAAQEQNRSPQKNSKTCSRKRNLRKVKREMKEDNQASGFNFNAPQHDRGRGGGGGGSENASASTESASFDFQTYKELVDRAGPTATAAYIAKNPGVSLSVLLEMVKEREEAKRKEEEEERAKKTQTKIEDEHKLCQELRNQGNHLYMKGLYQQACGVYSQAISIGMFVDAKLQSLLLNNRKMLPSFALDTCRNSSILFLLT